MFICWYYWWLKCLKLGRFVKLNKIYILWYIFIFLKWFFINRIFIIVLEIYFKMKWELNMRKWYFIFLVGVLMFVIFVFVFDKIKVNEEGFGDYLYVLLYGSD